MARSKGMTQGIRVRGRDEDEEEIILEEVGSRGAGGERQH